jgi:hypothetical protein
MLSKQLPKMHDHVSRCRQDVAQYDDSLYGALYMVTVKGLVAQLGSAAGF